MRTRRSSPGAIATSLRFNNGCRFRVTVIGPAANEVARLDGLSKKLKTPIVASATFNTEFPEELVALGTHEVQGVSRGLAAFTTADLAPPPNASN